MPFHWSPPPGAQRYDPVSYLDGNCRVRPGALAVLDPERQLTFVELRSLVRVAAGALLAEGLCPGEAVGVHLANSWEYVVLELAIPHAGGVILPLPMPLATHEMEWALSRSGATMVISSLETGAPAGVPSRCRAILTTDLLRPADRVAVPQPDADPDRVVEIALTSGTTGLPRLASLNARLKQATFEGFTRRLEIGAGDRILVVSPVAHGLGGMCLFGSRVGAALVMLRQERFDADGTVAAAAETRATHLVGVPTNIIRMLNSEALSHSDLSAARVTAVAGSLMPPEVARAWEERTGSKVCVFYGSMDAGQLAVGSPADTAEKRWNTVGRPHDVAELKIVDPDGRALPEGEAGEICMRGPTVQDRYWGERDGPFSADGFAHTGDLGFLDQDGYLHLAGRLSDIIIRGGANINPTEVETILRRHPAIADACVVGRPDRELGERVVACVVPRQETRLDLGEIRKWLEDAGLAYYKWPEALMTIHELPLSGPGKIARSQLRRLAAGDLPMGPS